MYYNRDLSWLEFNYRVLEEAASGKVPLYDKLKFLSIFSSNLDEFFSIRYPVILAISNLKIKTQQKIDSDLHAEFLENVQKEIEQQFTSFGVILTQQILPALEQNNIILYYNRPIEPAHVPEVREIFLSKVLSFLQPIFLNNDLLQRFQPEANKIYMILTLTKKKEEVTRLAIIKVPSDMLKRFYKLSELDGRDHVIFIDDIIRENSGFLFPGFEIAGIYCIKFNRNEDLDLDEDYGGNVLKKIERQLVKRARGPFLRASCTNRPCPEMCNSILPPYSVLTTKKFSREASITTSPTWLHFPRFGKAPTYDEWKPLSLFNWSEESNTYLSSWTKEMSCFTFLIIHTIPFYSFLTRLP